MDNGIMFTAVLFCAILITTQGGYDPDMDNILFSMNWPGTGVGEKRDMDMMSEKNILFMTTSENEKYKCFIPIVDGGLSGKGGNNEYTGPSPYELLNILLEQTSCSYRIETYWTYELCHGKHLRQYHEEKEMNKKPKLQEYFLGKFDRKGYETYTDEKQSESEQEPTAKKTLEERAPTQKVLGLDIAYFALNYTGGTNCDLTGHTRRASIRYVCQEDGKGEIYELKEMSTCEYEVVVLTSALCTHPLYGPKKDPVNKIQCHSVNDSPRKPKSLTEQEQSSANTRYNKKEYWNEDNKENSKPIAISEWWDEEDEDELSDDLEDEDESKPRLKPEVPKKETATHSEKERPNTDISSSTDRQLLNEFLLGEYCIQGGTGWWKHEFCYGKKVTQHHEDRSTGKVVVMLGQWDEEEHKAWLRKYPSKKPKPSGERKSISQFYGMGDVCELTKRHRVVEVKLKCKENSSQPHAVAIYLIEPTTCEYILVVESPILCDVIEKADEFGLVTLPGTP